MNAHSFLCFASVQFFFVKSAHLHFLILKDVNYETTTTKNYRHSIWHVSQCDAIIYMYPHGSLAMAHCHPSPSYPHIIRWITNGDHVACSSSNPAAAAAHYTRRFCTDDKNLCGFAFEMLMAAIF